MYKTLGNVMVILAIFVFSLACLEDSNSQEPRPNPVAGQDPEVPQGIEVQARGPVHEAFATPTSESRATPLIPKKPPANLDEMPPEERPEGDVVWIGGYWSWDDDRQDFLWVSGCWRSKPASREWVPGYWREQGNGWQWVSGFWALQSQEGQVADVTYHPEPPAVPNVAPPAAPPGPDMFYVPGSWAWIDTHYVWRAGFYTRVRPGYVYVPGHYHWSPYGYVHVAGYWDYALPRRGLLYAPVVVNTVVVGPRFVYTPCYAVSDTLVLDTLFIRPSHCHYYFGDYYGPRYVGLGFHSSVVYSRSHYDAVVVYRRWEYRDNPNWFSLQINLVSDRHAGRAPLPPRTLVQQRNITNVTNVTNVKNVTNVTNVTNVNNVLAPARSVVAARGSKTVAVDPTARVQAKQSSQALQQASVQRLQTEAAATGGGPANNKAKTAALKVPTLRSEGQTASGQPGPLSTKGNPNSNPGTKGGPAPTPVQTKGINNPQPVATKDQPAPTVQPKTNPMPPKTNPMVQPKGPPRNPPPPRKGPPPRDEKKK